jgi:2-methylcitrate dehydratase PrpD
MGVTQELAEFVCRLKFTDLPKEVIDKAKELFLDQLGVQLACSTLPWSKIVYEYIKKNAGTKGKSTILNYGLKAIPEDVAFVNASFGHGFEMDDLYVKGQLHPGCVVVPAAFAVGERDDIAGEDLLVAITAGYDVMSRIGAATRVSPIFHPTSAIGPFGAAAATCKALGIDNVEVARNALSVASSFCGGLGEFGDTGGTQKRMHAGMASRGGLTAAFLAQRGLAGPTAAIEGGKGFARAFSYVYHPEEITQDLGKKFKILDTAIKIHCCCATVHAAMDAALQIRQEHDIKSGEVEEIVDETFSLVIPLIGTIIEPKDVSSMQFSAAFNIALAIVRGSAQFGDYTEKNRADREILSLAKKVKITVDEEIERRYPESQVAKLTVKLTDGSSYTEKVYHPKGTSQNPITKEEIRAKFRNLARIVLANRKVEQIIETVDRLETLKSVRVLSPLLTRR